MKEQGARTRAKAVDIPLGDLRVYRALVGLFGDCGEECPEDAIQVERLE
jgi:hypothetical protein